MGGATQAAGPFARARAGVFLRPGLGAYVQGGWDRESGAGVLAGVRWELW